MPNCVLYNNLLLCIIVNSLYIITSSELEHINLFILRYTEVSLKIIIFILVYMLVTKEEGVGN